MGEVEVYNSDLAEFLNLAAKLGITGISENNTLTEAITCHITCQNKGRVI